MPSDPTPLYGQDLTGESGHRKDRALPERVAAPPSSPLDRLRALEADLHTFDHIKDVDDVRHRTLGAIAIGLDALAEVSRLTETLSQAEANYEGAMADLSDLVAQARSTCARAAAYTPRLTEYLNANYPLAAALESPKPPSPPESCTGGSASWCPVHGDCTCPRREDGEREMDGLTMCPLHDFQSAHPAPSEPPSPPKPTLKRQTPTRRESATDRPLNNTMALLTEEQRIEHTAALERLARRRPMPNVGPIVAPSEPPSDPEPRP